MRNGEKRRFKTIWAVVTAAREEIEKHRKDPQPDLTALKKELENMRMSAGYFFNVENPFYNDRQYTLPLDRTELEEVYGNALFNTIAANYLSHLVKELEELEAAPAHEC